MNHWPFAVPRAWTLAFPVPFAKTYKIRPQLLSLAKASFLHFTILYSLHYAIQYLPRRFELLSGKNSTALP